MATKSQTKRDIVQRYGPVGQCIYCGATGYARDSERRLAEEHIIPYGLNGDLILLESSCRECERTTGRIDSIAQRGHLLGPRAAMGLRSRKSKSSDLLPLFVGEDYKQRIKVPPKDCPSVLLLPHYPDPAILWKLNGWGLPSYDHPPFIRWFNYDPTVLRMHYGIETFTSPLLNTISFCRMLAKIGHSFAVAKLGLHSFTPLLRNFLREPDLTSRAILPFVGGAPPSNTITRGNALHHLSLQRATAGEVRFLLVEIRLFAQLGAPRYRVVVGTEPKQPPQQLPSCSVPTDALHNFYRVTARVD